MPFLVKFAIVVAGVAVMGRSVGEAGEGVRDVALGVAVLGGAYVFAKRAKVI